MCGHVANVSRLAASLNMRTRSAGPPSNVRPRSRPFSRSLMADAIGKAGMCLFCFINSATKPEQVSFNELCGNSKHIVFHWKKQGDIEFKNFSRPTTGNSAFMEFLKSQNNSRKINVEKWWIFKNKKMNKRILYIPVKTQILKIRKNSLCQCRKMMNFEKEKINK